MYLNRWCIIYFVYLAGFLITLPPNGPFGSNSCSRPKTIPKVAIMKTKSAAIAFSLLLALSLFPFLFLRYCDFGAVLGVKKPAF